MVVEFIYGIKTQSENGRSGLRTLFVLLSGGTITTYSAHQFASILQWYSALCRKHPTSDICDDRLYNCRIGLQRSTGTPETSRGGRFALGNDSR